MRSVADVLGTLAASLYVYVPSTADLRWDMLDAHRARAIATPMRRKRRNALKAQVKRILVSWAPMERL